MSSRKQAKVKWFNNEKGYGFLTSETGDVMIHHKNIHPGEKGYKTLIKGELVEYQEVRTENGLAASDLRRLQV